MNQLIPLLKIVLQQLLTGFGSLKHAFFMLMLLISVIAPVQAQIGILTNTPDPSAVLDIVGTTKGLLIPRVTLTTSLTNPSPVSNPATGLLVFNSGSNQTIGFYYWNGSKWVSTAFSTNNWSITGNSSTSISNNFIGTKDNQHLGIRTNNTERMRIESDGQILVGFSTPTYTSDLFSVHDNSTQTSAINAYAPNGYGFYTEAGAIGFLGKVNNATGYALWAENQNSDGYGAMVVGCNSGAYTLNNHHFGLSSHGDDGIFCVGHSSTGNGIIAGGNNLGTLATITEGAGGSFTGYHGVYGNGYNSSSGVGVVGVGNDGNTYHTTSDGSGGAFTGYHGSFSFATESSEGTGVIGVGNDGNYYLSSNGSGGAFTGYLIGVAGWTTGSGGYGVYGRAMNGGYGVFSSGNFAATGSKSFIIDDPLDPPNKMLKHYCIESPEVLNMYRGNVILNSVGEAIVTLPEYFNAININFSYNLTAIGKPAPGVYIKEEIDKNGKFTIAGGNANQKISWVVYAERNDPYMQKYPESKRVVVDKQKNRGKYLQPELYNQPASKGIFYSKGADAKSLKGHKTERVSVKKINNERIDKNH
ncbi:MAG: hypothetical protein DRJ09_07145 [Bacteroidetes bacterium]|nr:MAG: hypothetical protein DRJ09_07145 [Bacteroidota bacterium]